MEARLLRPSQTPKAEMELLPVLVRRHGVLAEARVPLRVLVTATGAGRAAINIADRLTAARRSRWKQERSENILLAHRRIDAFCAATPECNKVPAHALRIIKQIAVHGVFISKWHSHFESPKNVTTHKCNKGNS